MPRGIRTFLFMPSEKRDQHVKLFRGLLRTVSLNTQVVCVVVVRCVECTVFWDCRWPAFGYVCGIE